MAKYRFSVGTCYVGSTVVEIVEIPDEELEVLTEEEVELVVPEYFNSWLWSTINSHWERVE